MPLWVWRISHGDEVLESGLFRSVSLDPSRSLLDILQENGLLLCVSKEKTDLLQGTLDLLMERVRDQRGSRWLEDFVHDVRFGIRMLWKQPGFAAGVVLTLALGIGANTTIFSVVNVLLLRPLPYHDPDRLVRIASIIPKLGVWDSRSSDLNVLDWQERNTVFELIALRCE